MQDLLTRVNATLDQWKRDTLIEWEWDPTFTIGPEGSVADLVSFFRLLLWPDEESAEDVDFSAGTSDCEFESTLSTAVNQLLDSIISDYETVEVSKLA